MLMTLDLLTQTSTLHPQPKLHPLRQSRLRPLLRIRQQLLHSVLPRQLDKLSLSAQGVFWVVPFAGHRVLPREERVGGLALVKGEGLARSVGRAEGEDG